MLRRKFGAHGPSVSVIGQGTWQMETDDRNECVATLRAGLDAGMDHVDTAELYGQGEVERLVREAIAGRRDQVFLVSKVMPSNASRQGTIEACERSLRRLGTDHLDCYLLHWVGRHPLADTLAAFDDLVRAGKIKTYGVSNFDEGELAEAVRIAGPGRIACNQVLYHLEERAIEHRVLGTCREHGVALVAYSPFAVGRFPAPSSRGGRVLDEVARAHGVSARQVALAFLTRDPIVLAIPKTTAADHARDNARAGDLVLTHDELGRIDEAFPRGRARSGVPTA